MKILNIIFIIVIMVITVITPTVVAAVTVTPEASSSPTTVIDKLKQIEQLKEKIATKVAELREKEKGGISGNVKSTTKTTIVVSTKTNEQNISYSEDTIFFRMTDGKKSDPLDFKQGEKLKTGDSIAALGYFDSSHSTFAAKYIYLISPPTYLTGKITDKDNENYTISVKQPQGEMLVDIETYTKIFAYSQKTSLTKSGFSKLKENDIVHIFASLNPKEENRVSALKIISLSFTSPLSSTPTTEMETTPTAEQAGK